MILRISRRRPWDISHRWWRFHAVSIRRLRKCQATRRLRQFLTVHRLPFPLGRGRKSRRLAASSSRGALLGATVSTASLTETDVRVRDAVLRQLDWDPEVDAGAVGVSARNGTVTLTGYIDTYAGKVAAAPGIAHVDNRLVVNPPSLDEMTDEI